MSVQMLTVHSIFLNLIIAVVLGALIGVERQLRNQHTGLVTHALVALGAAAYSSLPAALELQNDLRMSGQVVTGIGFLGAGLIIRDGLNIKGLSTSATIWATGAVGVFVGYGFLFLAFETTLLVVLLNLSLVKISKSLDRFSLPSQSAEIYYSLKVRCPPDQEATLRAALIQSLHLKKIRFRSIASHLVEGRNEVEVDAVIFGGQDGEQAVEELVSYLSLKSAVHSTSWAKLGDDDP